ncbi:MAG: (deoxy)nucleoside triphosphate pyrophosphohydrolase [Bacteroidales bacterium]|nr:(deoxy)nucleoside triphosphate pyrophosphohydrolase [Bacteroidales bacterium]
MKTVEVVAALIRRGALWFATQRGYGEFEGRWEFPGGKMEPGETPQQALSREICEEFAVEINIGELLTTVEYDYPKFHLRMHCYLCTLPDPSDNSNEPKLLEAKSARWLHTEELPSLDWLPADRQIIAKLK